MQNQRTKFVVLIVTVAIITFGWIIIGTGSEEVPYVSIGELQNQQDRWSEDRIRLGGLVEDGSISFSSDRLKVDFVIIQEENRLPVRYQGLTPDMFADGAEVIIEGQLDEGVFLADNLMTKCASRYETEIIDPDTHPQEI